MSEQNPDQIPDAETVLTQLAASIAFLPQDIPEGVEPPPEGSIALPVIEQDGNQFVPVFTSSDALAASGANPTNAVEIPIVQLAMGWPSDDLWLAVDPSTPDGLTLPSDVVRALPGLVGAGSNGVT